MIYAALSDYRGELLSGQTGELWLLRASREIDRLTLGRAEGAAADLAGALADACCRMAECMALQAETVRSSRGGSLASASNDGYSESYRQEGELALGRQLRAILAQSLGQDSYGLLYRGVG